MKTIKKVAISHIEPVTGSIIDSNNISDKTKNTYSARVLDSKFNDKANASHNHDDRYYTESEIDTKLLGKSDTSHNHDGRYKPIEDFKKVTGTISFTNGSGAVEVDYPSGFNAYNCVPIAFGVDIMLANSFSFFSCSKTLYDVRLGPNKISIACNAYDDVGTSNTKNFQLILMYTGNV